MAADAEKVTELTATLDLQNAVLPLLEEARHTFLNLVRSSYLHQFESGFCDTWPALRHLLEACAVAHDSADEPLDEWARSLANLTGMSRAAKWLAAGEGKGIGGWRACLRRPVVRLARHHWLRHNLVTAYDMAASFLQAPHQAAVRNRM